MREKNILTIISTDNIVTNNIPTILAKDEEELQTISSELGSILGANVYRLSNGIVILTSTND